MKLHSLVLTCTLSFLCCSHAFTLVGDSRAAFSRNRKPELPTSRRRNAPTVIFSNCHGRTKSLSLQSGDFDEKLLNDEGSDEILQHESLDIPKEVESISVIYESENVLAIHKPPNISHHNDETTMGIVTCVRYLQSIDKISYKGRIYSVHRLDKPTSGILLFAKSPQVAQELTKAFREKTAVKYYVALSNKKPKKKKQGWVKGDMVQSRRKTWKLTNSMKNPAISRFWTSGLGNCEFNIDPPTWDHWNNSFDVPNSSADDMKLLLPKTLILFRPHTGQTHQLRVTAKSLGLGILGDILYSDSADAKTMDRMFLHAIAIHVELENESIVVHEPPTSWFGKNETSNGIEKVLTTIMKKHCEDEKISSCLQ